MHHHAPSHRVERLRRDAGAHSDHLRNSPVEEEVGCLRVQDDHRLNCVVEAKVSRAVDDDALNTHIEAAIQAVHPIRFPDLMEIVSRALELAF